MLEGASYQVPFDKRAQLVYFRAGNSADALITLILLCNGKPIRYFPIGAESAFKWPWPSRIAAVMDKTRASKGQVNSLVEWLCGSQPEEDPAVHYYVPGVPLAKPDRVKAIREQRLKSVSAVFGALADGEEDPASKPGLASLLNILWKDEYINERDAGFINDRVHGNIQKVGTFSVIPEMPGGLTSPEQLRRIADVAEKYRVPMARSRTACSETAN